MSWAIIALCGPDLVVGGLTTGARGRRRAELNAARLSGDEVPASGAG